ncbi:hypothetical protein IFM89_014531 [Coptis chinensis]|uniref:Uncharacterized protein n=1 Tax=Coptis chinensis TaxID=261450 RepID=A0A835LM58_9MAGN|nr:hypothetical protein IFM89_014531 [Coptis chinensis]
MQKREFTLFGVMLHLVFVLKFLWRC